MHVMEIFWEINTKAHVYKRLFSTGLKRFSFQSHSVTKILVLFLFIKDVYLFCKKIGMYIVRNSDKTKRQTKTCTCQPARELYIERKNATKNVNICQPTLFNRFQFMLHL